MALLPSDRFAKVFAAVLKEAWEKSGLSQRKLADLSGVGRSGIVPIEAGRRLPSIWAMQNPGGWFELAGGRVDG
jgi:DNA-binding XRE family transcriptional regulator